MTAEFWFGASTGVLLTMLLVAVAVILTGRRG